MAFTWITSSRLGAPMVFPDQTCSLPQWPEAEVCGEQRQDCTKTAIKENSYKIQENSYKICEASFASRSDPSVWGHFVARLFWRSAPSELLYVVLKVVVTVSLTSPRSRRFWGDFWTSALAESRVCEGAPWKIGHSPVP